MKYIVVMGHTHCGGIRAYTEHRNRLNPGDFIDNWMSLIAPAAKRRGRDRRSARTISSRLEQASIIATMDNLMTFPWIKSRVESRQLELLGAYFDVGTGDLAVYDPALRALSCPVNGESVPHVMTMPARGVKRERFRNGFGHRRSRRSACAAVKTEPQCGQMPAIAGQSLPPMRRLPWANRAKSLRFRARDPFTKALRDRDGLFRHRDVHFGVALAVELEADPESRP